jgi:hypothetical protein
VPELRGRAGRPSAKERVTMRVARLIAILGLFAFVAGACSEDKGPTKDAFVKATCADLSTWGDAISTDLQVFKTVPPAFSSPDEAKLTLAALADGMHKASDATTQLAHSVANRPVPKDTDAPTVKDELVAMTDAVRNATDRVDAILTTDLTDISPGDLDALLANLDQASSNLDASFKPKSFDATDRYFGDSCHFDQVLSSLSI